MARRQTTSPVEDVIRLMARLPWWAGVGVALVTYFMLHAVASHKATAPASPDQLATAITQSVTQTLAQYGQYLIPALCLIGAATSALGRRQRRALLTDVAQNRCSDALDGMTWHQFELLVGEAFRLQGYQVVETGGNGPDGGIDLVLRKGREKHLVQCKQWKALKVGVDVVRQLYGVMAATGATSGFVVTSGRFTRDAEAFASGRNVKLIDGPKLLGLIQQAQTARGGPATATPAAATLHARSSVTPPTAASPHAAAPACPACAKPMVRRQAKRGANAGKTFWGCTGYPTCRGTRLDG